MVTDRRRVRAGVRRPVEDVAALVRLVEHAAGAAIELVQVREPDLSAARLTELVGECVACTRGSRTRVVVNDRLDVALAASAAGVHLKAASVPSGRARAIAPPGWLMGRSVHSVEEGRREGDAGDVDYLLLGTLFDTASKPAGHPTAGPGTLARLVGLSPVPVLGIGGVTAERLPLVARTGAAGVAAIGLFVDLLERSGSGAGSLERFTGEVEGLRARFRECAVKGAPSE